MKNVLLIGGPAAGKRMAVESRTVRVPVYTRADAYAHYGRYEDALNLSFKEAEYKALEISFGGSSKHTVMVDSRLTVDQALALLLEGYLQPPQCKRCDNTPRCYCR